MESRRSVLLFLCHLVTISFVVASPDDCQVRQGLMIDKLETIKLWTYIGPNNCPLTINLYYRNRNLVYWRDGIVLSNTDAKQYSVRDGNNIVATHPTTLVVPEGWTTLTLDLNTSNFTILYEKVTLLSLSLDFPLTSLFLHGIICRCSANQLEWKVSEGEEVEVPLQRFIINGESQELRVSSLQYAEPYITFPNTSERTYITANTTLRLNVTMQDSSILTDVYQIEDTSPIRSETQRLAVPLVVRVGSDTGNLTLIYIPKVKDGEAGRQGEGEGGHHKRHNTGRASTWVVSPLILNPRTSVKSCHLLSSMAMHIASKRGCEENAWQTDAEPTRARNKPTEWKWSIINEPPPLSLNCLPDMISCVRLKFVKDVSGISGGCM